MNTLTAFRRAALALVFSVPALAFAQSGSWYNPAQSGHGLAVDQLAPDSALLLWFTYDFAGNPMPLYAEGTREGAAFSGPAYAPRGPRFNDFDPAELQFEPWGRLSFQSQGCNGTLAWNGDSAGTGTTPLRPLAAVAGCGAPAAARLAGLSGTWSHPQLQGAGLNVQVLSETAALVYWYAYDAHGNPLPLYIEASISGQKLQGRALAPRGLRFGEFARRDLSVAEFGRVELEFHDCESATLRYETPLGNGEQPISRLTRPLGSRCELPAAMPANLPVAYTGTSTQDTWLRTKLPTKLLIGERGDLVLVGSGWHRGRFHREQNKLFLRFDDGLTGEVQIDPATGVLAAYLDSPTQIPFWLELAPETLPAGNSPLAGGYGKFVGVEPGVTRPELVVAGDGSFVLAKNGEGRITHFDAASGRFAFDFRYYDELGGYDEGIAGTRVIGLGRLVQTPQGPMLRLMGTQVAGFTGVFRELVRNPYASP